MTSVSIIIPTRNRGEMLRACVDAVLRGDVQPTEVVVVDQSDVPDDVLSRPGSRDPRVRYVADSGRGVSRARNIGLRLVNAPVVALIDDDIIADRDWLGALVSGLREGDPIIRSGNVRPEGRPERSWSPSVANLERDRVIREPIDQDVLFTGSMAMTTEVVDAIGYFDERFGPGAVLPAATDNDYGFRALRAGIPIELVAGATATHLEWRGAAQLTSLSWCYGRGQGAFYAKHFRRNRRYVARRASGQVATWSLRVARGLIRDRGVARREAAYLAGLAVGAASWGMRARRLAPGPSEMPAGLAPHP